MLVFYFIVAHFPVHYVKYNYVYQSSNRITGNSGKLWGINNSQLESWKNAVYCSLKNKKSVRMH